MEEILLYSLASVLIVSLISFVGVFTLSLKTKTLSRLLLYFVAFSAGALLGDAFIHLLPEIVGAAGFTRLVSLYILSGILTFFVVEKVIHWRHCHILTSKAHPHAFAYMNLVGDAVHNLTDGIIIAASFLVSIPVGIATTIAVIFHEIPQEIGDFGVLIHGGFKARTALLMNFASALTSVIGMGIAFLISGYVEGSMIFLSSFAAGGFIYIAGADLIPELHKCISAKAAFAQLIAIMLGIGVMYLLIFLE